VRRGRRRALLAAAGTFVAMSASGAPLAHALPGGSYFELEGNAVDNPGVTGLDWSNAALQAVCDVTTCTAPTVAATGIVSDLPADLTGADATYFQGGGSKDDNDIPQWGTGGNGAPDKNELTNAYAAATRNGNNDLIVVFGADRYDTSGSAEMGFWLLQNEITTGGSGKFVLKGTTTTATHVVGDVLVLSDFTTGGQLGQIAIYKWVGSGGDAGSGGSLQTLAKLAVSPTKADPNPVNPADCTTAANATNAIYCATINRQNETAPWPYKNKDAAGNHSTTTFPQFSFIEGAVNIGHLTGGQCFASFLAETRTAPEIQGAQLKDYALGSFAVCKPTTTMKANAMTSNTTGGVAHLGQSITYTAYEKNDGTDPLNSPSVTGTGCTSWSNTSGDTNTNGKLDPGETWVFQCTTSYATAGTKTVTVVGHGLDPRFGNKDVTFCASPDTTKICDADETNTISITVINPTTDLTATAATASPATIHSGESTTLTFYEKNDGDVILTNPAVTTDDLGGCATTTRVTGVAGGDANNDNVFDPGETWKFTCSTTDITATTTVTAVGTATDPLGATITYPADAQERTTVDVTVINPDTQLTTSASAVITYTFKEFNNGDAALSSPSVSVTAGQCNAAPAYQSGDDGNGKLDVGETWVFTCTKTLAGPTTDTGSASATATGVGHGIDATTADVTHCEIGDGPPSKRCSSTERDATTVTITNAARD
jgi:hypothetical protein